MKKLLVLSFIFAITCSGQVFSMENGNDDEYGAEHKSTKCSNDDKDNDVFDISVESDKHKIQYKYDDGIFISDNSISKYREDNLLGDKEKRILTKFSSWSLKKLAELKNKYPNQWNTIRSKAEEVNSNKELFMDTIMAIIKDLITEAMREKNDVSTTKKLMNYISDHKKAITESNESSKHEMLNVFIKIFYSSLSNGISSKEKEQNERMKFWFKDIVYRNVGIIIW